MYDNASNILNIAEVACRTINLHDVEYLFEIIYYFIVSGERTHIYFCTFCSRIPYKSRINLNPFYFSIKYAIEFDYSISYLKLSHFIDFLLDLNLIVDTAQHLTDTNS